MITMHAAGRAEDSQKSICTAFFEAIPSSVSPVPELCAEEAIRQAMPSLRAALEPGLRVLRQDGMYLAGNEGLDPSAIATAVKEAGILRVFGPTLYFFNGLRFEAVLVGNLAAGFTAIAFSLCNALAAELKDVATNAVPTLITKAKESHEGSAASLDKKLLKIQELPSCVALYFRKVGHVREVAAALQGHLGLYQGQAELDGVPTVNKLLARNGIVDLTTGALSPPTSLLPMSRVAGCSFDRKAKAPRFEAFLREVFPDEETITYVQTVLGAYLRGKACRLQGALILQGAQGAGGKTVFLNAIVGAFGSYGKLVPEQLAALFILPPGATKRADASGHDSAGASFAGVRLAFIDELAEGSAFNEVGFKSVTGRGDADDSNFYEARAAYSSVAVKFPWLAGLTFATNSPIRAGHHAAILRRMNSVECHSIAVPAEVLEERRAKAPAGTRIFLADAGLSQKLKAEREGILAWLVEGAIRDAALEAAGKSIEAPEAVLSAGCATQRAEGTLDHFASVYLRPLGPGEPATHALASTDFAGLLSAYFEDLCLSPPTWIMGKDGRLPPGFYPKLAASMGFQGLLATTPVRGAGGSRIRRIVSTDAGKQEGVTYTDAAAELFGLPPVGSPEFMASNGLVSAYLADKRTFPKLEP